MAPQTPTQPTQPTQPTRPGTARTDRTPPLLLLPLLEIKNDKTPDNTARVSLAQANTVMPPAPRLPLPAHGTVPVAVSRRRHSESFRMG